MSKLMQLKELKNKVRRNGFDNSRRVLFTAKGGEILPIHCMEVLPGDVHTIDLKSFGRSRPLNKASFARMREYYDVYFVPYRLLYNKFNDSINQVDNQTHASSIYEPITFSKEFPHIVAQDVMNYLNALGDSENEVGESRKKASQKLLSYLLYRGFDDASLVNTASNPFGNQSLNMFPLLGYQKIYQDYFRNALWENSSPWTYNVDYVSGTNKTLRIASQVLLQHNNLFDLQYCNYDKDYFHGILPSPQYGDETIANLVVNNLRGNVTLAINDNGGVASPPLTVNTTSKFIQYQGSSAMSGTQDLKVYANLANIFNDPNTEAGVSVLAMRYANALQKWKEITLSSEDLSFKSLLEKHWNVTTSELLSNRCTYLGGISSNLDVNPITNTNLSEGNADMKATGSVSSNGVIRFENKNNEYGLLYVIYHCKPIIEWRQRDVMPKMNFKTSAEDYAIPELDSIGMQGVPAIEFVSQTELQDAFGTSVANWYKTLGYAPRYVDYKTQFDVVLGEFQTTIESMTLPYSLTSESLVNGSLSYIDFKVNPSVLDNLFAVDSDRADHFENSVYINIKSVRNLDRDGLPY